MLSESFKDYFFIAFILNLFLWGACVLVVAYIKRLPLYHPVSICLVYHFIGYVYRPYVVWTAGMSNAFNYIGRVPNSSDMGYAILLSNIGLAAIMAGLFIADGWTRQVPLIKPFDIKIGNRPAFYAALVVMVILGLYSTSKSYSTGLDSVMAYRTVRDDMGGQKLDGISGYTTALAEFLPALCILLFAIPRTRRFSYFFTIFFVAVRMYCGGQRTSFIVVVLGVALMALVAARRRFPPVYVLGAMFLIALCFDIIGRNRLAFREVFYGQSSLSEVYNSYQVARGDQGMSSDVTEFDLLAEIALVVPAETGFSYGSQYLRILIWPIPRQLWPDKPVATTSIDIMKSGNFFGLSRGIYADSYTCIGLPGMVLILFGMAYGLSRLYRTAVTTKSLNKFMFFWLVLAYMEIILRDGGTSSVYYVGFSMIAVMIMNKVGRLQLCPGKST